MYAYIYYNNRGYMAYITGIFVRRVGTNKFLQL